MSGQKPRILVVGSLNIDMVIHTPSIPQLGESIIGQSFELTLGGKGANQAVAAARLGGCVRMIGQVGADPFADQMLAVMKQEGIFIDYINKASSQSTGTAFVMLEPTGQNRIISIPGANATYDAGQLESLQESFDWADLVISQLEMNMEVVIQTATLANQAGKPLLLNPGPAASVPESLLSLITIMTPNETEAEALTGISVQSKEDAVRAATVLRDKGVQNVIVTLGGNGAVALDSRGNSTYIPAYKVETVNTVGAGDTFSGAFAVEWLRGASFIDAAFFASASAALAVTRHGSMSSIPNLIDVQAFLIEHRSD